MGPTTPPAAIRLLVLAAVIGLLISSCQPPVLDQASLDWPQFRGPEGRGISDRHPLPTNWQDGSDNIRWNTTLPGIGNSSPIAAGGRVFLTAIESTELTRQLAPPVTRMVLGLDLETGELLWKTDIFAAVPEKRHRLNTNAAPTPVTDGESVWAYFGSHLARLTLGGELLWTKIVDPTYPRYNRYGVASSPILVDDMIVLFQDREFAETPDIGWMAAFDKESGEEVWRREWDDNCCTYSTPIVWQRAGRSELIHSQSAMLLGLDVTTGDEVWRHDHGQLQVVASPVFEDDIVCSLGGAHGNKGNFCVRVTQKSGATQIEELWNARERAPEMSSPVFYRGRIFAITMGGVMTCYDALSGTVLWFGRVPGTSFHSALVAGDGKIYAPSNRANTVVLNADSDQLEVLAVNELTGSENNSSPALAGGCLLLRTANGIVCIEAESGQDQ